MGTLEIKHKDEWEIVAIYLQLKEILTKGGFKLEYYVDSDKIIDDMLKGYKDENDDNLKKKIKKKVKKVTKKKKSDKKVK